MTFHSKRKIAFSVALCMLCSMIEMVIPKPSFIKIGFSNIPIMLALFYGFSIKEYSLLVMLRLVCQALINGTMFSYAFVLSVSAGISSALAMFFAYKIPTIGFVGLSEIGAFCSNITQLYVSHFFMGQGVYYLAPAVLGVGVVTSFILGVFTPYIARKIDFQNQVIECDDFVFEERKTTVSFNSISFVKPVLSCTVLIISLFSDSITVKAFICVLFGLACFVSKKKIRLSLSVLISFETVLLALMVPYGKVLFRIWFWPITLGAFQIGLKRVFVLLSSIYFSRFVIPDKETLASQDGTLVYLILFYFRKLSESQSIKNNRDAGKTHTQST